MNNFFITGFPRSRTAWLANLFTYKDCFCFHELCKNGSNVYDLISKLNKRYEDTVGTADSGFVFYYKDIMKLLPESKILIIERDINEVKKSLSLFMGFTTKETNEVINRANKALNSLVNDHKCIMINYERLDEESYVENIWNLITKKTAWDHERWLQLYETKIELIKEKWLSKINITKTKKLLGV